MGGEMLGSQVEKHLIALAHKMHNVTMRMRRIDMLRATFINCIYVHNVMAQSNKINSFSQVYVAASQVIGLHACSYKLYDYYKDIHLDFLFLLFHLPKVDAEPLKVNLENLPLALPHPAQPLMSN